MIIGGRSSAVSISPGRHPIDEARPDPAAASRRLPGTEPVPTEVRRALNQAGLPFAAHLPELGTIDLVLLTNPRTDQRPAVRALIATVLASGSKSLAVPNLG